MRSMKEVAVGRVRRPEGACGWLEAGPEGGWAVPAL